MKIVYKTGNILDTTAQVIAHQVNSMGVMGSGVAKCIRDRYPEVYELYRSFVSSGGDILGYCQMAPTKDGKFVANLGGQYYYRGYSPINYDRQNFFYLPSGDRYTNYEALCRALEMLHDEIEKAGNRITTLAIPQGLGCYRGGGDWNVVLQMIESVFVDLNITIEFWIYEA